MKHWWQKRKKVYYKFFMELTEQQKEWADKRKQGASPKTLRDLLIEQEGKCALSGVNMIFDKKEGTPKLREVEAVTPFTLQSIILIPVIA